MVCRESDCAAMILETMAIPEGTQGGPAFPRVWYNPELRQWYAEYTVPGTMPDEPIVYGPVHHGTLEAALEGVLAIERNASR